MEFVKVNMNPSGWNCGDCVIRALSKAEDLTWGEVYDDLVAIGRKKHRMPNDTRVYKKWLEDRGYVQLPQPKHLDGTKYTVMDYIDEMKYSNMKLLIHITNHILYAYNGVEYDTGCIRWHKVGKVWAKKVEG